MPKMKTKKGAAKRLRMNKKGKAKFKKANLRHILTSKPKKRKRNLRKKAHLQGRDAINVKRLLPTG